MYLTDPATFLVIHFLLTGSDDSKMRREGTLSENEAGEIFVQGMTAVVYAFTQNFTGIIAYPSIY